MNPHPPHNIDKSNSTTKITVEKNYTEYPKYYSTKCPRGKERFNQAKFKILSVIKQLNSDGIIANSVRIAKLLNKDHQQTVSDLYHYSVRFPYLKRIFDYQFTDGCFFKYTLKKEGLSVLPKFQRRKAQGRDLNLKHL